MAKYSSSQKTKLLKKLKCIDIKSEKDILNLKLIDLNKVNEIDENEKIRMSDIEMIWEMQRAIGDKGLLDYLINSE